MAHFSGVWEGRGGGGGGEGRILWFLETSQISY